MRFLTISGFLFLNSFALFVFNRSQLLASIYQTPVDLKGNQITPKKMKSQSLNFSNLLLTIKVNLVSCEKLWYWYLGHSPPCGLESFLNLQSIELKSQQASCVKRTLYKTVKKWINPHKQVKFTFFKSRKAVRFYILYKVAYLYTSTLSNLVFEIDVLIDKFLNS